MIQVGNRIIFDQDGEIIYQTGEMQGDVLPRKIITNLNFIDVSFGSLDYLKYKITGVNAETNEPIVEEILHIETETERLQREKKN